MQVTICLLPGDGIGPEIVEQARLVLEAIAGRFGHQFNFESHLMGGCAIDDCGDPLPDSTLAACRSADAVLLGAVGGPKWDDPRASTRPEAGLLRIRKELGLFANLRPVKPQDSLIAASPLRPEIVSGVDILFVRELTGGIYFGDKGRRESDGHEVAFDEMAYSVPEIERVVRVAGEAAMRRGKKLTSVDKANVLEVSRLWREVAERVAREEFPQLEYEVVLVDAMAMHLISRPTDFDVVVTGNMFGDTINRRGVHVARIVGPASLGVVGRSRARTLRTDPWFRARHRRSGDRESVGDDLGSRDVAATRTEAGRGSVSDRIGGQLDRRSRIPNGRHSWRWIGSFDGGNGGQGDRRRSRLASKPFRSASGRRSHDRLKPGPRATRPMPWGLSFWAHRSPTCCSVLD